MPCARNHRNAWEGFASAGGTKAWRFRGSSECLVTSAPLGDFCFHSGCLYSLAQRSVVPIFFGWLPFLKKKKKNSWELEIKEYNWTELISFVYIFLKKGLSQQNTAIFGLGFLCCYKVARNTSSWPWDSRRFPERWQFGSFTMKERGVWKDS